MAIGPPGFVSAPPFAFPGSFPQAASAQPQIPVPAKPEGPPPADLLQEAIGPSLVTLTGVARDVTEDRLSKMVQDENPGFLNCYLYTSCNCDQCVAPLQHQRYCMCRPCNIPAIHCTWAIFLFRNPTAAEYGWLQIRWQILRTIAQLDWQPRTLTLQHPDPNVMLGFEERRLLLEQKHGPDNPPPPPPLQDEAEQYTPPSWGSSQEAVRWSEALREGAFASRKRRRSSSVDDNLALQENEEEQGHVTETNAMESGGSAQETTTRDAVNIVGNAVDSLQQNGFEKENQGQKKAGDLNLNTVDSDRAEPRLLVLKVHAGQINGAAVVKKKDSVAEFTGPPGLEMIGSEAEHQFETPPRNMDTLTTALASPLSPLEIGEIRQQERPQKTGPPARNDALSRGQQKVLRGLANGTLKTLGTSR